MPVTKHSDRACRAHTPWAGITGTLKLILFESSNLYTLQTRKGSCGDSEL